MQNTKYWPLVLLSDLCFDQRLMPDKGTLIQADDNYLRTRNVRAY